MNGKFGIWFLAAALCFMTTTAAMVAFQRATDRSALALVHWAVIALALVAPLVLVPGLLSTGPHEAPTTRKRCSRVLIVIYLPLTSALMLLAYGGR